MSKKLIAVIGAESSGNRLIFETLKKAGNYIEDEEKLSAWWGKPESMECEEERITLRSLPYGGIGNNRHFVNSVAFADAAIYKANYDVRFVITTRDANIVEISKIREHTLGDVGLTDIEMQETRMILGMLVSYYGDRCFLWNYETFMFLQDYYLQSLYRWLGINSSFVPELFDGNKKYLDAATE